MNVKTTTTKVLASAALVGACFAAAPVSAAILDPLLLHGLVNTIQDQDAERIVDRAGNVITTGTFAVGQTIQSALRFDTMNGTQVNVGLGSLTYQLTAVSELMIASKVITGTVNIGGIDYNTARIFFTATGNLGAGSLVNIYEHGGGTAVNFTTQNPTTAMANIMTQNPLLQLGFAEADDYWFADVVDDIALTASLADHDPQQASGVFGLSVLNNPGGINIVKNGVTGLFGLNDVVGNASIYQREAGTNSGWLVSSNLSASFRIPEPETLALLGLGLLGMGLSLRRKQK